MADEVERLHLLFDLYASGEAMMCENLRRRFPQETDEEIEMRILDWLAERPGAPHGDAIGTPGGWPRNRK